MIEREREKGRRKKRLPRNETSEEWERGRKQVSQRQVNLSLSFVIPSLHLLLVPAVWNEMLYKFSL